MDIYKKLNEIGAVKFGNFVLKSKQLSPIYIDLRQCISHPTILKKIALMIKKKSSNFKFDRVLGVPYSGIFFACAYANLANEKMVMIRKEKKEYGLKKLIEGSFEIGQKCLIIEDVVSTGESLIKTIQALKGEGLIVRDVLTIFNRGYNLESLFSKIGCELHSLLNIFDMLDNLQESGLIDKDSYKLVNEFINKMSTNVTI